MKTIMMNRGVHLDSMISIPIDLIIEILSRLPVKSIVRFYCVSKLWKSMLHRPYFRELFLTMSRTRPRLLLAIQRGSEWTFFSSAQPQSPHEKSSLVVSADFHMRFIDHLSPDFIGFTSGLMSFSIAGLSSVVDAPHLICNPSTGRFATLPSLDMKENWRRFLGFDPIGKQYKVLFINYDNSDDGRILTVGSGEMRWRKIQCPLPHKPSHQGICINGNLYYFATEVSLWVGVIVCFDVRFEKFKFIDTKVYWSCQLVDYKGKLGVIHCSCGNSLRLSVLEDGEKPEWSTYVYTLPEIKAFDNPSDIHAEVTSKGEIVLWRYVNRSIAPLYVFYYNPEKNTLHTVEIHGVGDYYEKVNDGEYYRENSFSRIHVFVDHVEDLLFNIMKSTCPPIFINPLEEKCRRHSEETSTLSELNHHQTQDHHMKKNHHQKQERHMFEGVNKFDALCLLDDDDDDE